jgi:nucleotide-binding universal stress UspA family protein
MSGTQNGISIDNVLFATDFSPITAAAFSYAAAIANSYQSKLYAAHVIETESFDLLEAESTRILLENLRGEAGRKITEMIEPLHFPRDRYEIVVGTGVISDVLMDIIQRDHIDIAVLGTHGRRAFKKLIMGSITEEVFRMASCPVLTVGPNAKPPVQGKLGHILYAVEFAPDSTNAARYAVSLAEHYGANLTLMNVREDMPASANAAVEVTEPAERWISEHIPADSSLPKRLQFESGFGPAADAILDFAGKAGVDMIVISVRQLDPVIASHLPTPDTAYALISLARCPVLTVR